MNPLWSTRASHAEEGSEKDAIREVHPDTGSGCEPTAAAPAGSAPVSVALRAPVVIARWLRKVSPATRAARQQASVKQLERVPERRRAARESGSGRAGGEAGRQLDGANCDPFASAEMAAAPE